MAGPIEIRCPIYGFIPLDEWEREIISQPAFQRLRRIRQLAWTDYVYPGAMHTRFEHSLGVMHMATLLFDGIVDRCWPLLRDDWGYDEAGKHRYLLRDSYHSGVEYGKYDWRRIVATTELIPDVESGALRLGVSDAGRHAAEALIIARYMMFIHFDSTTMVRMIHR
jgi:HD superfamily phosphohydrolase